MDASGKQSISERRRIRRDHRRAKRRIHSNPYIYRFLRVILRILVSRYFRATAVNAAVINRSRGPAVILSNHSAVFDPQAMGVFVTRPIHFVVSDSQLRSKVISFLLGLTGAIPKTKAVSDLDTVKQIVTIKRNGGVIGIFPEGQSSWDGHQLPMVAATGKLVQSLKIPVYVGLIKGAYLSWPRWGIGPRRGRVQVEFQKLFSPEELRKLSPEHVNQRIVAALTTDPVAFARAEGVRYAGRRGAEYLERVLFICPQCTSMHTLHSGGTRITCTACGDSHLFTGSGLFIPREPFATIREWNVWQLEQFDAYLHRVATEGPQPDGRDPEILREESVLVREGYKMMPMTDTGTGTMVLYRDRIEVHCVDTRGDTNRLSFPLHQIEGMNVQNNEHLEFYVNMTLYRVSPASPRRNTYKWNHAVHFLNGLRETVS